MDPQQFRAIADQVLTAERAEAERTGDEVDSEPRPGAAGPAIAEAEARLGKPFPESYRAFLAAHDGWHHFAWGMSLFGTAELTGDDYDSALETLGYDEELTDELEASIIIGASEDNAGLLLLTPGGEVVEHFYTEEGRHPDLATFLRGRIDTLAEMRDSALQSIAAVEREWDPELRAADDAALVAELRPLVEGRRAPRPPASLESFIEPGAAPTAPGDLVARDDDGEMSASLELGLVLYLGAAPDRREVIETFRAFRRHFPLAGPYQWQLADHYAFVLETAEDPESEPFADELRVDDSGFFGVRIQAGDEERPRILNVRGIPPEMYGDDSGERRASFVEVLVPVDEDPAALEALCLELADILPIRSGQGGYVARARDDDGWDHVFRWCRRFFGVAPASVDGWLAGALRRHAGAGWLTVLGRPFVEALGSFELSPAIARHDRERGVVLVAGEPSLGDVARGELPAATAEVARLLEPVSLGGYAKHGMISMGGVLFTTSASELPGGFVSHHATGAFLRRLVEPERFLGPSPREVGLELIDRLRRSMDDEQLERWSGSSELDELDGFGDLLRALFNGSCFTPDRSLAIEALEHAAGFPDSAPPQVYNNLLIYYLRDDRVDDAIALVPVALETAREGRNPHTYHNAACALVKVGRLDEALDCVRRARAEGYPHMDKIASDDDLAPLRELAEFQSLVTGDAEE